MTGFSDGLGEMDAEKILIVEDDRHLLEVVEWKLRSCGYFVSTAENGAMGLQALSMERVDLVLTDFQMPGFDGFELLRRARARGVDCPFVIMTGANDLTEVQALGSGFAALLRKPFEFHLLNDCLDQLLRRRRRFPA